MGFHNEAKLLLLKIDPPYDKAGNYSIVKFLMHGVPGVFTMKQKFSSLKSTHPMIKKETTVL
jgi:hypothetical protein